MKMYCVGGCVRDMWLGVPSHDTDIVIVGSTPEEMLKNGFKQVGADFPVFLDEFGTEYALARTERKSGHGYNGFTTNHSPDVTLEDDLKRRDLTINAMAFPFLSSNPNDIIDPFGGREDIKNKVLRHVSEAFADDPVRVLRLARFHARFGPEWSVAPETMEFCRQMVAFGELNHLTRERVLKEFEKALSEEHAYLFFDTLNECGALAVVLPELVPVMSKTIKDIDTDVRVMKVITHTFDSTSAKHLYARLSTQIENVESFEKRLNISIEWQQYAKMYRIFRTKAFIVGVSEHTVDTLYAIDAYRKEDIWKELAGNIKDYKFPHLEAFNVTRKIGFEQLTSEQQFFLKGKEIATAIKNLRKEIWTGYYEDKVKRMYSHE